MDLQQTRDTDLRNTRQMSMATEPQPELAMLDVPRNKKIQLLAVFSGDEFLRQVQYPILVEAWRKKEAGRVKRGWQTTFTEAERKTISSYYARFYKWHLVSGTPANVSCQLKTLQLLQRAVQFFAEI